MDWKRSHTAALLVAGLVGAGFLSTNQEPDDRRVSSDEAVNWVFDADSATVPTPRSLLGSRSDYQTDTIASDDNSRGWPGRSASQPADAALAGSTGHTPRHYKVGKDPPRTRAGLANPDTATNGEPEIPLDEAPRETDYQRDQAISGRVLDESGHALVGVGLTATAMHLFDTPPEVNIPIGDLQRHAISGTAGYYRFEQLIAGEYRINNQPASNYGSTQVTARTGVDFADIVLRTVREFNIRGVVTDTMGHPLSGALVRPQGTGARAVYTDSAGQFELQLRIQNGAVGVALRTELFGYRSKMSVVGVDRAIAAETASLSVALEPLQTVVIVTGVIHSVDGATIPNKTVQLSSMESQRQYHATSDADGRFLMPAVEVANGSEVYELLVAGGAGFAAYFHPDISLTEQGLDIEIFLEPEDRPPLTGRMVNLNGTPIANYSLTVRAQHPPYQTLRVTSDGGGNFVIPQPPDGPLVFESRTDPRQVVSSAAISSLRGQQMTLTLDIGRDEIYGQVVNANGEPVAAPDVVVNWRHEADGMRSYSTRRGATDAQGQFSFAGLGPGVHTILVDATGYAPARVEHDVARDGYQFSIRMDTAPDEW